MEEPITKEEAFKMLWQCMQFMKDVSAAVKAGNYKFAIDSLDGTVRDLKRALKQEAMENSKVWS